MFSQACSSSRGVTSLFAGQTRNFGQGIMIRPREKIILRAVKFENDIKKQGISRFNKRFRQWSQHRVRQYRNPLPVSLTADLQMMDGQYLSACVQKAAALRKHDTMMWRGYAHRVLELKETMTPEQLGFVLYGFGKSGFIDDVFYREMAKHVETRVPELTSHAMMAAIWCFRRIQWSARPLAQRLIRNVIDRHQFIRPNDFLKICHGAASMGPLPNDLKDELNKIAIGRFEEMFAQVFRNSLHPLLIANLWNDETTTYLLNRFPRIVSTLKPENLLQGYESAVTVRVLRPTVWEGLEKSSRSFFVRLSQRYIPSRSPHPSEVQWDVSEAIADYLKIAHRNSFRWGPYAIDIGIDDLKDNDRRDCFMVDGPSDFFFASNEYLPLTRIRHEVLHELGWDVRRVVWSDWVQQDSDEKKKAFLEKLLDTPSNPTLLDPPALTHEVMRDRLCKLKDLKARRVEVGDRPAAQIDLHF